MTEAESHSCLLNIFHLAGRPKVTCLQTSFVLVCDSNFREVKFLEVDEFRAGNLGLYIFYPTGGHAILLPNDPSPYTKFV